MTTVKATQRQGLKSGGGSHQVIVVPNPNHTQDLHPGDQSLCFVRNQNVNNNFRNLTETFMALNLTFLAEKLCASHRC